MEVLVGRCSTKFTKLVDQIKMLLNLANSQYQNLSATFSIMLAQPSTIECSEKYKSFKLKIPQPDSKRRHSLDFRTVFGIMIEPFSSCEIGKT